METGSFLVYGIENLNFPERFKTPEQGSRNFQFSFRKPEKLQFPFHPEFSPEFHYTEQISGSFHFQNWDFFLQNNGNPTFIENPLDMTDRSTN